MGVLRCFLLWFGVTVVTPANDILKTCDKEDRLYHVAITDIHGDLICGGSLISDSWILTIAYCYKWGMKIILGGHPGPGRVIVIKDAPLFIKNIDGYPLLMLLKLPHPTKIEPVKLPTHQVNLDNEIVKIAGYRLATMDANNETDSRESDKLQCVKIKVSNSQKVNKKLWFYRTSDNRVDISWNDAGGAMIYKDMIYGVMIYFGRPLPNHRAPYVDVHQVLGWIQRTIT